MMGFFFGKTRPSEHVNRACWIFQTGKPKDHFEEDLSDALREIAQVQMVRPRWCAALKPFPH